MDQITIGTAQKLTAPNPFCLITTLKPDGSTNIMALSWWMHVSNKPAKIAACISKKGYTNKLIKETKEFALCVVSEEVGMIAHQCGTCSGESIDKAEKFGIELIEANMIKPKIVKHSKVVFECKLLEVVDGGDHDIFIAQVDGIFGDASKKQLYAIDGYSSVSSI